MTLLAEIRRRTRFVTGPIFGLAVIGYFSYHLVQGDRGLIAWMRLTQQIRDAKATAEQVRGEREALDNRVARLRPEHLDPDLLDERARATLNVVGPNEIVILKTAPQATQR
ncbi:MAG TPA: septum formation initiator family protein [Stellaceae bacterium]|jgi:cell division protein FtsB